MELCEREPQDVYDMLNRSQKIEEWFSLLLFCFEGIVAVVTTTLIYKRQQ